MAVTSLRLLMMRTPYGAPGAAPFRGPLNVVLDLDSKFPLSWE
jgi:hypothetical protein